MPRAFERVALVGYVAAVLLAVGLGLPPFVRAPLVIGFTAFCPGFAWTRTLGLTERWLELVIAIPLSLAITMLVAMTTVYLNVWDSRLVLVCLVGLTLVPVIWDPNRVRGASQATPESE
jgi:hypothetical protein